MMSHYDIRIRKDHVGPGYWANVFLNEVQIYHHFELTRRHAWRAAQDFIQEVKKA